VRHSHILLVIDHLNGGGAASQITILAQVLNRAGYKVTVFTYHEGEGPLYDTLADEKISVITHESKRKSKVFIVKNLRQLMMEKSVDCVVSFLTTPNFYASLAALFSPKKVPVVVSERASIEQNSSKQARLFRWVYMRLASMVVFNSHDNRQLALKAYASISDKARTIYNAIDLPRFKQRPDFDERSCKETINVLSIATPRPSKNVMIVAKMLDRLKEEGRPLPIIFWAGPVDLDDEVRAHVRFVDEYLDSKGLSDHWNWLGKRNDLRDYISEFDVLIHPSFAEGLPNAVCEALSCGLPVLASDVCDHPLLVGSNKERGYLFNPSEVGSLTEMYNEFQSASAQEMNEMRLSAIKFAEDQFSKEKYSRSYDAVISELLKKSEAR